MPATQTNVKEIGEKLVNLCLEGRNLEAIDTLYSPDIESIEACEAPGMDRIMKGIDAIRGKNQWWFENNELHEMRATGPLVNGDRFAVIFDIDVTCKQTRQRIKMQEVGLYTVKGERIVKEEFFYSMDA